MTPQDPTQPEPRPDVPGWEQGLEAAFEGAPQSRDQTTGVGEGEGEPTAAPDTAPPPAGESTPADDAYWEYEEGLRIDRAQARDYATFDRWLEQNPDVRDAIQGVLRGDVELVPRSTQQPPAPPEGTPAGAAPSPAFASPTPPEGIDLEDPATRALWEQQVQLGQRLAEMSEQQRQAQEAIEFQGRANAQSLVNRAKSSFAQQHELDADEIERVYALAAQTINVEGLVQMSTDPITGVPRQPDVLRGMEEALEMAQWSIPEFREKEMDRRWTEHQADVQRKGKINALGGTGGGQPRPQAQPQTREEHRAAMIEEIAAASAGNFTQPE